MHKAVFAVQKPWSMGSLLVFACSRLSWRWIESMQVSREEKVWWVLVVTFIIKNNWLFFYRKFISNYVFSTLQFCENFSKNEDVNKLHKIIFLIMNFKWLWMNEWKRFMKTNLIWIIINRISRLILHRHEPSSTINNNNMY